jgi:hypothetical protein
LGRTNADLSPTGYAFHTTFSGDVLVQFNEGPPDFVITRKDIGDDDDDSDASPSTRRTDVFGLPQGGAVSHVDVGMYYSPKIPFAKAAVLGNQRAHDVYPADIDTDGDIDVFARFDRSGQAGFRYVWYENLGGGGQFDQHEVFVLDTIDEIESFSSPLADLDGDEDPDLLLHDGERHFWFRNTGGAFEMASVISAQFVGRLQAFDMNVDGDLDLLGETIDANGMLPFFENQGGGSLAPVQLLAVEGAGARIVPADLDGDGDVDFLRIDELEEDEEVHFNPLPLAWLENDGADPPGFVPHELENVNSSIPVVPFHGLADDLDADGDLDIVAFVDMDSIVFSTEFGSVGYVMFPEAIWFENTDGAGAFGAPRVIVPYFTSNASIADIDGDGDRDVLTEVRWVENAGGGESFLSHVIHNDFVSFDNGAGLAQGSAQAAADLDGDGDQDVIAAWILGEQGIRIYRNDATATPDILDVAPDPRNTPVGLVTIIFPEGVTGVDVSDFALTRNGQNVDLAGLAVVQETARRFTLDLSSVTAGAIAGEGLPGNYVLTLTLDGSGITTITGQPLTGAVSDAWAIVSLNEPPTAHDDAAETREGEEVVIAVLTNDTDDQDQLDAVTVTVVSPPSHGAVSVDPLTGQITYSPAAGFFGDDTFRYTVSDGQGAVSNEANVTIDVANGRPFQNRTVQEDVDGNGKVEIVDLIALVGWLREEGPGVIPDPDPLSGPPTSFVDVDGDGAATVSDLLKVVAYLRDAVGGGGEPESQAAPESGLEEPFVRSHDAGIELFTLMAYDIARRAGFARKH